MQAKATRAELTGSLNRRRAGPRPPKSKKGGTCTEELTVCVSLYPPYDKEA